MRPVIFNLFKPRGQTSYDVLRVVKKTLPRDAKVGHFGTLDPFACGVLLVGAFGAARLNDYIHQLPKTYLAVGKLGVATASGDCTNPLLHEDTTPFLAELALWPREKLNTLLQEKFKGEYWQAPPMYSAAKFQGEPLHAWAKRGVNILKPPVARQIYALEILHYNFPWVCFRCTVSSGTYVRVLFTDMAQYLGTWGTLFALMREQIGPCTKDQALRVTADLTREQLMAAQLNPDQILPYPKVEVDATWQQKIQHGMPVPQEIMERFLKQHGPSVAAPASYLWPCYQQQLLGLTEKQENWWAPKIVWPLESPGTFN
jgi:tRNA pseudouridine55 synthase